jgi:hypothetical protein
VTAGGKQTQGRISKHRLREQDIKVLSRHPNFQPMSPPPDPRERGRCSESMLIHPPIYSLRRTFTNRRNNIRQGLQAVYKDPSGDSSFITIKPRQCS